MFAQTTRDSFYAPTFGKKQVVLAPVVEEPIHFCDNAHMDELCEIIERDERVYTVFANLVEHVSAWKQ